MFGGGSQHPHGDWDLGVLMERCTVAVISIRTETNRPTDDKNLVFFLLRHLQKQQHHQMV